MKRRSIFIPIALECTLIPFFFINLNEGFTRIFNPSLSETWSERILHSFRPTIMAIFLAAVVLFSFLIYRLLTPLFKTLEGTGSDTDYRKARQAAIRLPFVIIVMHTSLWALGTTFFFMINKWKAPWGVPFLWSLLLGTGSGLNGSLFAAVAANLVLLPAKQGLKISEIYRHERDVFIRNKYFLIVLAIGVYFCIYAGYAARFFLLQDRQSSYQLPLERTYLLLGLGFLCEAVLLLVLANMENRRQIRFVKEKLEYLARGEGDLTQKIHLLNFDEIGELCVTINRLIAFLAGLIENVRNTVTLSLATGDTLMNVTGENESQFDVFRKELERIIGSVERQGKEVAFFRSQQSDSIHEFENLLSILRRQTQAVEGVTSSLATILSEQEKAAQFSRQIEETASVLRVQSGENQKAVLELSGLMDRLSDSLGQVLESAQAISEISSKTQLLSLNASIESVQAGVAGKGFAVVADEIKRLAEASKEITGEIVKSLFAFQEQIEEAVQFSEVFRGAFEKNNEKTGEILARIGKTTGALGHLEEFGEKMRGDLNRLKETSTLIDSTSRKETERTASLRTSFEQLSNVIGETTASATRISAALNALTKSQTALGQATRDNLERANQMQQIADRFITGKEKSAAGPS